MLNPENIKKDFPLLQKPVEGKPLFFLDSASTSQKPRVVIEALRDYYESSNANVHRGVYRLSEIATAKFDEARKICADFVGAAFEEIIFTRNATEAANLVAYTYGEMVVNEGDAVVVTALEHHSNFLPWQQLCRRKGAEFRVIPVDENGLLMLDQLENIIDHRVKIVAVTQMSNVVGTMPDLKRIIAAAHAVGAKVLVDAAQGASHLGFDVQDLDTDFAVFTGHKMLGPTGIGFLYGKRDLLEQMPPFMFGGGMIKEVSALHATWADLPAKFEGGTPDIGGAIALGVALKYLQQFSFEDILAHDRELLAYALDKFGQKVGVELHGTSDLSQTGGILSFAIQGVHPHDIASIFADTGVAIRAGHHCAMPLIQRMGLAATARLSFHIYNTKEDVDAAFAALENVYKIFKL